MVVVMVLLHRLLVIICVLTFAWIMCSRLMWRIWKAR